MIPESPKSQFSQNSTKPNSVKPIKTLLAEDFNVYVKKIQKVYQSFKFNHYSKYYTKIKSLEDSHIIIQQNDYIPSNKLSKLKLPYNILNDFSNFFVDKKLKIQ